MQNFNRFRSLITWIILMFLALAGESRNIINDIQGRLHLTVVVRNEIDPVQLGQQHPLHSISRDGAAVDNNVNITCYKAGVYPVKSRIVSQGETVSFKAQKPRTCRFEFYAGEFDLSTNKAVNIGVFGKSPESSFNKRTIDKVFLKFNASGAFRRTSEESKADWSSLDPKAVPDDGFKYWPYNLNGTAYGKYNGRPV